MRVFILTLTLLTTAFSSAFAFCGFYVAQISAELFNNKSEVIYVRDGNKSTITMSNDFEGPKEDFAMVVPVPVVLDRKDIKIAEASLFNKLYRYSAPRMAEYYDQEPCRQVVYREDDFYSGVELASPQSLSIKSMDKSAKSNGVKIQAKYNVEEYEILILSAKRSSGLEDWLHDNNYRIPKGASEVLEPYIKDKMKFFVVKVDMDKIKKSADSFDLRPLQISFESDKFMLPIRLGMANAKPGKYQDLIIYMLTREGQVETTNYRTVKIPTDKEIPLAIKSRGTFNEFYKDLFEHVWRKEDKNVAFLEYSWPIGGQVSVKCDPCNGPPPIYTDLVKSGVDWINGYNGGFTGNVHFSRLHVRYDRVNFPQDLAFQETPSNARFQGRYVVRNPARLGFECSEGQAYLENLRKRRIEEVKTLASLTGWSPYAYKDYITEFDSKMENPPAPVKFNRSSSDGIAFPANPGASVPPLAWLLLVMVSCMAAALLIRTVKN